MQAAAALPPPPIAEILRLALGAVLADHEDGCADVLDSMCSRLDTGGEAEVDALIAGLRWALQAGQPDFARDLVLALHSTLAFCAKPCRLGLDASHIRA